MADAYARLSDRPGVCEGPSGGGATYLLPGLAEAEGSCVPVVGLNTTIPVRHRGRGVLTELDQEGLFESVTKWNGSVDHPEQVPGKLRTAFREATAGRPGATHLSLPMDSLDGPCEIEPYAPERTRTYPAYRQTPPEGAVEDTVRVIEGSERPMIVAGGGVHSSRAWFELRDLAETVGVPVATTLTGVGCIGDSPYSVGVVGENGSREYANEMVDEADALLLLGTAVESVWTEKWTRPTDGEKRIVHVDVSPESIGRNYDTEVPVPGDLQVTLEAFLDRVSADEKWDAAEIRRRHESWIEPYAAAEDDDAFPIRPERMVADARAVLSDDAVVVSDPGTSCPYFAALYEFPEPGRHWVTPRAHGALGYTIPGVVGARFARPEAEVVGFTGDGSVGTSMGELETLARYDVDATIVVVDNESFSWIEAGQRSFADFSFGVDFDGVDYASVAEDVGIDGYRVEAADEFRPTLADAVGSEGPALVDLPTRPLPEIENVPVDWLEPDE
jgi:acetolactate synthase-1/2/3 large subunit